MVYTEEEEEGKRNMMEKRKTDRTEKLKGKKEQGFEVFTEVSMKSIVNPSE
jgi:hypothetical protein